MLGPLSMGALSLLAWPIVFGDTARGPKKIEYVIPAGTAALLAGGGEVTVIPNDSVYVVGDQLVFHNKDSANHQIGPFWLPAGTTASVVLKTVNKFDYNCSVHSSGSVALDVRSPTSPWLMLVPTLALGLPLGAGLAVGLRKLRRQ
ncbi:MAG: hypothetical protein KA764_01515 [Anaerolineales bacterium]|nr:hypothetical protein [Anaerolineales bacterium]